MSQTLPRWKIWLLAARPATLTAALAPLAVGGVVAFRAHGFALWPWMAALLGAVCIQLGTNFANDVFDFEKGADTADRQGPLRVTQAGLVTPQQVKRAMVLAFAGAVLCGIYLVALRGWPLVALGVASIASGVLYTGGPKPLGYLGLGDVFVFAFFGVAAVVGTVYVQTGTIPLAAWVYSVPVGASCTAILVVNNLRDAQTDVLVGKRTLAVRFGPTFVRWEYALLWALAVAIPLAMAVVHRRPWMALPVVCAVPALALTRTVFAHSDGPPLNATLAKTAKLHLVSGLLLALGLWLDRILS